MTLSLVAQHVTLSMFSLVPSASMIFSSKEKSVFRSALLWVYSFLEYRWTLLSPLPGIRQIEPDDDEPEYNIEKEECQRKQPQCMDRMNFVRLEEIGDDE